MSAAKLPLVVATQRIHASVAARFDGRTRLIANPGDRPWQSGELREHARDADALIAFMPDTIDMEFLAACPRLRIVAGALKGYDNIDVAACTERGVWVTVCRDLLTEPTADLAMGLAIALTRRLLAADAHVRGGAFDGWRPIFYGAGLQGATLGVIGMGAIGQAIARRAAAFGLRVLYDDPRELDARTAAALGVRRVALEELLAASDVVMPLVHLTAATRHLLDAAAIARMRPGAFLVNVGRGSVVDEAAVADALEAGHLAGYAADVFAMEDRSDDERPSRIEPRLLASDRTVLTPHIGSAVAEARQRIEAEAADNALVALDGRRPPGAVNDAAAHQARVRDG